MSSLLAGLFKTIAAAVNPMIGTVRGLPEEASGNITLNLTYQGVGVLVKVERDSGFDQVLVTPVSDWSIFDDENAALSEIRTAHQNDDTFRNPRFVQGSLVYLHAPFRTSAAE